MGKREDTYEAASCVFQIIIYLFFGWIILVFKGIQALLRGDWEQAIKSLAIPVILICVIIGTMVYQIGTIYIGNRITQQEINNAKTEEEWARKNPSQAYTLVKIQEGLKTIPGCDAWPYKSICDGAEGATFSEYKFTNTLHHNILQINSTISSELWTRFSFSIHTCMDGWKMPLSHNILDPGETIAFYCLEKYHDTLISSCIDVIIYASNKIETACAISITPVTTPLVAITPKITPTDILKSGCDLAGKWVWRATTNSGSIYDHVGIITQENNAIKWEDDLGWTMSGTISGAQIMLDGVQGVLTLKSNLTVTSDCHNINGTWQQSDGQAGTWSGAFSSP